MRPYWLILWGDLGLKPADLPGLTIDDALVVEDYADSERRRRTIAANKAAAGR
jgi:hypothetical protein